MFQTQAASASNVKARVRMRTRKKRKTLRACWSIAASGAHCNSSLSLCIFYQPLSPSLSRVFSLLRAPTMQASSSSAAAAATSSSSLGLPRPFAHAVFGLLTFHEFLRCMHVGRTWQEDAKSYRPSKGYWRLVIGEEEEERDRLLASPLALHLEELAAYDLKWTPTQLEQLKQAAPFLVGLNFEPAPPGLASSAAATADENVRWSEPLPLGSSMRCLFVTFSEEFLPEDIDSFISSLSTSAPQLTDVKLALENDADVSFAPLKKMPNLQRLGVRLTALEATEEQIRDLQSLSNLRTVSLDTATPEDVVRLLRSPAEQHPLEWTEFNVSEQAASDVLLSLLPTLGKLSALTVTPNDSVSSVHVLAQLPLLTRLSLNLSGLAAGSSAAESLLHLPSPLPFLSSFSLQHGSYTSSQLSQLLSHMPRLTALTLDRLDSKLASVDFLQAASLRNDLKELNLIDCEGLTDADSSPLLELRSLTSLSMIGSLHLDAETEAGFTVPSQAISSLRLFDYDEAGEEIEEYEAGGYDEEEQEQQQREEEEEEEKE